MKKRKQKFLSVLLIGWMAMAPMTLQCQTFSEFFSQKKTQKKYLLQQIVALQVYIGYARKGYSIAKDGLDLIGNLKNGEVNLHSGHFLSLEQVNPKIRKYARISGIMATQKHMVKEYQQAIWHLRQSGALTPEEQEYATRVLDRVLTGASDILDHLLAVCTDGSLEMTDDARLERVDILYEQIMEHHVFLKEFRHGAISLATARLQEKNDTRTVRLLYN